MNYSSPTIAQIIIFIAVSITGCATSPKASIEAGKANFIDGTVNADFLRVKAIVSIKDRRTGVSAYVSDCKRGHGALQVEGNSYPEFVNNVVASGTNPADQMFSRLCRDGLVIVKNDEDARERRRASMTPEEREAERLALEAERRALLQFLQLQQAQQAGAERNASRERAERNAAEALKNSKKSTTECISTSPTTVKCETK